MQSCKELDGEVLCWLGFTLVPFSRLLNYRRQHPVWDVLGWLGVALAFAGVIKQIVDIIKDKR